MLNSALHVSYLIDVRGFFYLRKTSIAYACRVA